MTEPAPSKLDDPAETPASSLGARLMNMYVSPTEVFDEVKASPPQAANWIVPLVIAIIVGIMAAIVVMSQGQILHAIREAQDKQFQKMVASGKMTQKQADQQKDMMDKIMTPAFMKVLGSFGAIFGAGAVLCLIALIFWLIGDKAFHGGFDFNKSLEAVGLTSMIGSLGGVISMLLKVIYGNSFANASPALFLNHFDPANKRHLLIAAFDLTEFWYLAVLSIGLSRFSRAGLAKSAGCVFGIWALFKFVPILLFGGK